VPLQNRPTVRDPMTEHAPGARSDPDRRSSSETAEGRRAAPRVREQDKVRWSALPLSTDPERPIQGSVCATVWPTRALASSDRWFDELYIWYEGFPASTTQRARIQAAALENAFYMLEKESADHVGITLSFGTIELYTDGLDRLFQAHDLVRHRIVVMLRGSIERLRSPYRVRTFIDYLRAQQVPVGYSVSAPRITMEMSTLDVLRPDFARVAAPASLRPDAWDDLVVGVRVLEIPIERVIVSGLESPQRLDLARKAGFGFGQGAAVRPPFAPPRHKPDATVFGPQPVPTSRLPR
jgi:hypothetical protein